MKESIERAQVHYSRSYLAHIIESMGQIRSRGERGRRQAYHPPSIYLPSDPLPPYEASPPELPQPGRTLLSSGGKVFKNMKVRRG